MGKEIVNQVQEVQRDPYRINPRRNTSRHILIKLSKIKYQEKNKKTNKRKKQRKTKTNKQKTKKNKKKKKQKKTKRIGKVIKIDNTRYWQGCGATGGLMHGGLEC